MIGIVNSLSGLAKSYIDAKTAVKIKKQRLRKSNLLVKSIGNNLRLEMMDRKPTLKRQRGYMNMIKSMLADLLTLPRFVRTMLSLILFLLYLLIKVTALMAFTSGKGDGT